MRRGRPNASIKAIVPYRDEQKKTKEGSRVNIYKGEKRNLPPNFLAGHTVDIASYLKKRRVGIHHMEGTGNSNWGSGELLKGGGAET